MAYDNLRDRRVTAYLDDAQDRERLVAMARERGTSMSKLAAELLAAAVKREWDRRG